MISLFIAINSTNSIFIWNKKWVFIFFFFRSVIYSRSFDVNLCFFYRVAHFWSFEDVTSVTIQFSNFQKCHSPLRKIKTTLSFWLGRKNKVVEKIVFHLISRIFSWNIYIHKSKTHPISPKFHLRLTKQLLSSPPSKILSTFLFQFNVILKLNKEIEAQQLHSIKNNNCFGIQNIINCDFMFRSNISYGFSDFGHNSYVHYTERNTLVMRAPNNGICLNLVQQCKHSAVTNIRTLMNFRHTMKAEWWVSMPLCEFYEWGTEVTHVEHGIELCSGNFILFGGVSSNCSNSHRNGFLSPYYS